jgi:hypothetical protein
VHLHGWLVRYSKDEARQEELALPEDSAIAAVMDYYGFLPGEVGVITVEGRICGKEDVLEDQAAVHFYPVFGGG